MCTKFYGKVHREKKKTKFVFRYDRWRDVEVTVKNSVNRRLFTCGKRCIHSFIYLAQTTRSIETYTTQTEIDRQTSNYTTQSRIKQ